jgi:superfamily II DNA or RNA helicase
VGKFHDVVRGGIHRILAVAPTASGKTITAAEIIRAYVTAESRRPE